MIGMLPPPSLVARSHTSLYEAFYRQVDPAETDRVSADEAAAFLRRSRLPNAILGKIWHLSDPQRNGYLDKQGFYVALKLIALHQNGKDLTLENINLDVPPPQLQTTSDRNLPAVDWNIKPFKQKKYEEIFDSMGPIAGKLPGYRVRTVMLNSKLPRGILSKIWELSDIDQDGYLSKEEFILAMHFVDKALENIPVPSVLPPQLISIATGQVLPDVLPLGIDNTMSARIRRSSTPSSDIGRGSTWVVNAIDKAKYDEMFHALDTDMDGFVTGTKDVKATFQASGLSRLVLARIWKLCDIEQNGKLNSEQFALAMYLVQQKLQGIEVPATLNSEMIPPTLRPNPSSDSPQQPHFELGAFGTTSESSDSPSPEQQIRSIFGAYGEIEDVNLFNRRSDKFGFIRFSTKVSAALAICACDGDIINGSTVQCNWSHRPDDNLPPGAVEVASPGLVMPTSASCGLDTVVSTSILENAEIRDATTTKEEKIDLVCKICMDAAVAVVFLPCGHLTSCQECSTKISQCPMCRKHITQKVRTYLS